jgi:uncharacterized protein YegJ (DUF2314 family)
MRFPGKQKGEKEEYLEAVILLLSKPRIIHKQTLLDAIPLLEGEELEIKEFEDVTLALNRFFTFAVMFRPEPYLLGFKDTNALAEAAPNEQRLRQAIRDHKAFVSVFSNENTPPELREITSIMTSVTAANLIDDTTLALWNTLDNRIVLKTEETVELLRHADRAGAFEPKYDGVVAGVDAKAEMAEAKRRVPEFVKAFEDPSKREMAVMKFPFSDPGERDVEFLWCQVLSIEGTVAKLEIMSEPFRLRRYRKGTVIHRELKDVADWVIEIDGKPAGLFTEHALSRAQHKS